MKYFGWILGGLLVVGLVIGLTRFGFLSLSISAAPTGAEIVQSALHSDDSYKTIPVTLGGETFNALVSDTAELRETGLSYRPSIADNQAMLFVFDAPGKHIFWMKDMQFSLDMIWLSADKKIVSIEKNVTPESYPNTFGPDTDSAYVVEVKAGTADRLSLARGQKISFDLTSSLTFHQQ